MKNILLVAALATSLFSCKKPDVYKCTVQMSAKSSFEQLVYTDVTPVEDYILENEKLGRETNCIKISQKDAKKFKEDFDNKAKNP